MYEVVNTNNDVNPLFSYFVLPVLGILLPIPLCDSRRNLTPQQVQLCKKFEDKHLDLLLDAKFKSDFECKKQFEGRRWNCTLSRPGTITPLLLPKLPLGKYFILFCLMTMTRYF